MGTLEFVNLAKPDLVEVMYRNDSRYPRRLDMKPWKVYRAHRDESLGVLTQYVLLIAYVLIVAFEGGF